ncbi:MAG: hypothetical protein JRI75_10010 [Deltaproteobacteria bacterium]|nr:hypothetical protein [Deltaproteobacteria bacterium]
MNIERAAPEVKVKKRPPKKTPEKSGGELPKALHDLPVGNGKKARMIYGHECVVKVRIGQIDVYEGHHLGGQQAQGKDPDGEEGSNHFDSDVEIRLARKIHGISGLAQKIGFPTRLF